MASPNRASDLPKSTNDTTCFFFWLQKYSWLHLVFSWHQLVKIPLIFVPSQRIENRWTSDGKRAFSRWFWFKRKEWKNVRFRAWKTSEKRLFYRLNRNSFIFKLFGMLHRNVHYFSLSNPAFKRISNFHLMVAQALSKHRPSAIILHLSFHTSLFWLFVKYSYKKENTIEPIDLSKHNRY